MSARPLSYLSATLVAATLLFGSPATAQTETDVPQYVLDQFGPPPTVPTGPLAPELEQAIRAAFILSLENNAWGPEQIAAVADIGASGDPRLAWLIADLMRFAGGPVMVELAPAAGQLLGKDITPANAWEVVTNHLIAWDIPAPPDYLTAKRAIFTGIVPGWDRIFEPGEIDWRMVSWGGVLIDDRAYDTTDERCNCIPAADNPPVTSAEDAGWLADDAVVFGVTINGVSRAYPRRIMEVREMVNDTLGGRDLGIPYCTLCGAAQAYFTDELPDGVERPILRTSGLLIRSNKVMYDITSHSVFDTFLGKAVTGPLAARGITLEQAPVVTTTWGRWKEAHPDTTVLAERLALGRDFDFRNNRDADGPIFPVGDVDPRLPVHEDIIGVVTASGRPVAFQRSTALAALLAGSQISVENIRLVVDAGGIRAEDHDGAPVGSHQAFWFAWSQFHPDTILWQG